MIIAAAIKFTGVDGRDFICHVPAPGRHSHVLDSLHLQFKKHEEKNHDRSNQSYVTEEKGFLTDKGEFLGRRGAMMHARDCKQFKPKGSKGYNSDELFSEDLW